MGIQVLHSRTLLLSLFLGVVLLYPPGAYPSNLQAYHTVVGGAGLVPEDLHALSLASGDLDGDGIADLAAGFADGLGRGRVGFFRLPSEQIYPDSRKKEKITQESNWPFEEPVWLDLPAAPDWLELIDVDRDGRRDLVAATRGEPRLFWLKRKGAMEFESPRDVALSGDPVLMRVLDVPRSDGWPDLIVGLEGSEGRSLLLFTHPDQLFQDPKVVQLDELPVDVARMRLGAEHRPTLAVASGQNVLLLSELTRRLKENPVEETVFALTTTPIRSLVAGQFDVEEPGEELAVLGEEGDIQFLAGTGLPCSKEVELSLAARDAVLVKSRVAAGVATPLVVLDKAWGTARVLTGEGEEPRLEWLAAGLGSTVAVEAMRLNPDGLDDLVILSKGPRPLQVVETQGSGAFVVNLESGERDFSLAKDAMGVFHCDIDNDPGNGDNCTLTAALQQADADPDPNTIVFAVDQVVMEKALPRIRDTVTIDGMEPKEGRSEVRVEIDAGSKATEIFNFDAGSEGSVIRGMVLRTNFGGVIKAAADDVTIEGNYIATDRSGTNPMSLGLNHGVLLRGSNSTVGGLVTEARNVLGNGVRVDGGTGNKVLNNYIGTTADGLKALGSGVCGLTISGAGNEGVNDEIPKTTDNTIGSLASNKEGILGNLISGNFCGVEVRNAPGNRILGNWIGSDESGQRRLTGLDGFPAMGNLFNGVEVVASNRTEITGNVIVASGRNGIELGITSTSNIIDNIVGVNAAGTISDPDGEPDSGDELGNRWRGIAVDGNDDPEGTGVDLAGNRIQENLVGGNLLDGSSLNSQNNTVFGNYVGTNQEGLQLGNRSAGVAVSGSGNTIGGDEVSKGNSIGFSAEEGIHVSFGQDMTVLKNNVFSNQGDGIFIDRSSTGTMIFANNILLNESAGVRIEGSENRVGSGLELGSNAIRSNSGPGIAVTGNSAQDNAILCNRIKDNDGLGIDLLDRGKEGPTENDPAGADPPQPGTVPDEDQGPNGLQNYPVLTQLGDDGLSGVLWSEPSTLFRLDFYRAENCNGRGQGAELLAVAFDGAENGTRTDENGRLDFSLPLFLPPETAVTATATRASDEFELLATSEFSPCISGEQRPPLVVNSRRDADDAEGRTSSDMSPGDGVCATGGTISPGGEPECTLRAAIQEANASAGRDRIHFSASEFGSDGVSFIGLRRELPGLIESVEIDGLDDDSMTPRVGLNDADIDDEEEEAMIGLELLSGQSLIRGISFRSFPEGIRQNGGGPHEIRGNRFLGCRASISVLRPSGGNIIGTPPPPAGGILPAVHDDELVNECVDPCNRIEIPAGGPNGGIILQADDNQVAGNHIVDDSGGVFGAGILINGARNRIGGSRPQDSNLIDTLRHYGLHVSGMDNRVAGNRISAFEAGVRVSAGRGNKILGNTFHEHSHRPSLSLQPIDLLSKSEGESGGRTPNDAGDRDPGPNDGQNYPDLTAALDDGMDLIVRGRLESEAAEDYTVQIYRVPENACPDKEVREAVEILAELPVTTSAGTAVFATLLASGSAAAGEFLAATATHSSGNTSEFSRCIPVEQDGDGDGSGEGTDPDDADARTVAFLDPATGTKETKVRAANTTGILILVTVFSGGREGSFLFTDSGEEVVLPSGTAEFRIVPERDGTQSTPLGVPEAVVIEWTPPEGLVADSFYNFGPTDENPEDHFYEFLFDGATGAEIFEDRILLHYVDGGRGDHDLTVNGEILTRGGPVTLADRFYFPQVGDGLVGNIQLQTSLVVQNTAGITPVALELFNSEAGFLTLDLDTLGPGSLFEFGLNPGQSVSAQSEGSADIQAGYAEILAAQGVGGTAVFSRSDADSATLLYEAGVPATQPLTDFTLFVDSLGDRETGLAVAFPSAGQEIVAAARLTLRLYDDEFNELAASEEELLPGNHFARFITQLFAATPGIEEMQGTVTVSSTEPVVAVTLRQTDDPQRGFPQDVPILTTFPVIPSRADLGLAGQGEEETVFLPQIGNGVVADIRLQTELIFVNSGADAADFALEFFDSTGGAQPVSLSNGQTDSRFDLNLGFGEALTLETDGAGGIQVGYARLTGPAGLGGTAVFRRSHAPSGTLLYEAGVPVSSTLSDFSLVVDNRGARDTGLAIVVPPSAAGPAAVAVRLYDTDFNLLAEEMLELGPGSHLPRFASELFPEVEGLENLEGTLTVSSTQPIAAITIRQNDEPGLQFPAEVPTLTTFPVIPGRSNSIMPSRR